jgi:Tfp pilus assembly protein PilZ
MSMKERRLVPRKSLSVPLRFRIQKTDEVRMQTGETVNVSEHGVYFTARHPVKIGEGLEMLFVIPRELTGRNPEEVRCSGRVVHVHPVICQSGHTGIGVQIESFEPVGQRLNLAS